MSAIAITDRDLSLFHYLHENKVASTKQITRDVFASSMDKTRKRLKKLRDADVLDVVCRDEDGDKSIVYNLSRGTAQFLKRLDPDLFFINRSKSNSVIHDLRLVDIRHQLTSKKLVTNYFSENSLQTSRDITRNPQYVSFRDLQVDALVELSNREGDHLFCALEYEASIKNMSEYTSKMKLFYLNSKVEAVLYVCKNKNIERAVKKTELNAIKDSPKKIYYALIDDVLKSSGPIIFQNQSGFFIEIT